MFTAQNVSIDNITQRDIHPNSLLQILQIGLACCVRAGLVEPTDTKQIKAFDDYAVDIKFNCKASDYLAKTDHKDNLKSYWGADREIAKASSKTSKKEGKGMHPFQLAIDNKKDLFIEYVEAIRGKAQLFWSRGLKNKVGIVEKTDEELAEEKNEDAQNI